MSRKINYPFVIVVTFFILGFACPGYSADFSVNSQDDAVDVNAGDGVCETVPGNGICTLRAAIQEANANATEDTIHIPAGTYPINGASLEDLSVTGDLDITTSMTLLGAGARNTILQGGGGDRVIHVKGNIEVSIQGVTINGGFVNGGIGDGISESGGGINNEQAKLTILNSSIIENELIGSTFAPSGGGVANFGGELIIESCTISHNSADPTNNADGGGIFTKNGPLTINNSTVSYNSAGGAGGGIEREAGPTAVISNSTIVYNSVDVNGVGGGGVSLANLTTLKNTLIANNTGPEESTDCMGYPELQGGNLIGTSLPVIGWGCNFTNQSPTDQIGTPDNPIDPKISPDLKNNGGPTDTHSLLTGSPAIDAGDPNNCPATDQRGVTRPQGDQCDIGAFELAPTDDANGNGIPDNQENNTGNNGTDVASGGCAISAAPTAKGFYLFAMVLIFVGAGLCLPRQMAGSARGRPHGDRATT